MFDATGGEFDSLAAAQAWAAAEAYVAAGIYARVTVGPLRQVLAKS